MEHSEADIRAAIRPLLDKYGELDTSEIKQKLDTVLEFSEKDKEMSKTRNEMLIIQRIGNIVAHQTEKIRIYDEGFIVNKNYRPALFTAVEGIDKARQPISREEIIKRKTKAQKFIGRKVNWGRKRERDELIGVLGEEFVYEFEKNRVKEFAPDSIEYVRHLSRLQGDGLGYDISSINNDGTLRRIEVKTTTLGLDYPFYMSSNEKAFFEENQYDEVYIYRVYNFNERNRKGDLKIISANELLTDYNFDPVSFAVTAKTNNIKQ